LAKGLLSLREEPFKMMGPITVIQTNEKSLRRATAKSYRLYGRQTGSLRCGALQVI
jgi:hypothetical protein